MGITPLPAGRPQAATVAGRGRAMPVEGSASERMEGGLRRLWPGDRRDADGACE